MNKVQVNLNISMVEVQQFNNLSIDILLKAEMLYTTQCAYIYDRF